MDETLPRQEQPNDSGPLTMSSIEKKVSQTACQSPSHLVQQTETGSEPMSVTFVENHQPFATSSRFSPRPPRAISLSTSATPNKAQFVGQGHSRSAAAGSDDKRTREEHDSSKATHTSYISDDCRQLILQMYGNVSREEAAARLRVNIPTFKRLRNACGIDGPWPRVPKNKREFASGSSDTTLHQVTSTIPLMRAVSQFNTVPIPQITAGDGSGGQNLYANQFQTDRFVDDLLKNKEPFLEEFASGSNNLPPAVSQFNTVPSCSTIPQITAGDGSGGQNLYETDTLVVDDFWNFEGPSLGEFLPSCSTVPHSGSSQSVNIKATYGDKTIKFQFPRASGFNELKERVLKALKATPYELDSVYFEYDDADGDTVIMTSDENLTEYLQLLNSSGRKLKIGDVPNR